MDILDYILVTLGSEPVELECEEDGSYLLSSLAAAVGCEVTGLCFKNEATGHFRFVKVANGRLLPPKDGWGLRIYHVSAKLDTCVSLTPSETQGANSMKCK